MQYIMTNNLIRKTNIQKIFLTVLASFYKTLFKYN